MKEETLCAERYISSSFDLILIRKFFTTFVFFVLSSSSSPSPVDHEIFVALEESSNRDGNEKRLSQQRQAEILTKCLRKQFIGMCF